MTPERWQRISQLCNAALARDVAERSAFLLDACPDDAELRSEVESLLARERTPTSFLAPTPGVDLILMSRHLERVGDHATSIAEMSFSSSRRETFAIIPPGRLREWPIQDRRHVVYAAVDGTS